jgi:hypothetical protein
MVCLTNLNLGCPFEMICSNLGAVPSLSFKGGDYPGLWLLALILDQLACDFLLSSVMNSVSQSNRSWNILN